MLKEFFRNFIIVATTRTSGRNLVSGSHDHAASCIRSVQYLKSFIVNRRRDTRKADNRRRRAL
jgi:hypothetical protein